VWPSATAVLL